MGIKSKARDWFIRRELEKQVKEKTMFGKLWSWFNGKKLVVGAIITILATVAANLPVILPQFGLEPAQVMQIVGIATMIVGGLHKLYKFIYKEDHP